MSVRSLRQVYKRAHLHLVAFLECSDRSVAPKTHPEPAWNAEAWAVSDDKDKIRRSRSPIGFIPTISQ